jgi:hypothetical protein
MKALLPKSFSQREGLKCIVPLRIILFALCVLPFSFLQAQVQKPPVQQNDGNDVQDIIENNAQQTESETFDYDAYIDELERFKEHPINLNTADASDLADLPLLNAQQISTLVEYIARNGKLISIYELQAIPEFDLSLINRLLPYVKVDNDVREEHFTAKQLFSKGKFMLVTRYRQQIEKSVGYQLGDGRGYLGRPFGLFARFRYNYGNKLSYGITAEKDAGEEFFKGSNRKGFDYYSGHIFVRDIKVLKALALGDYEVRLGQGLIMWSGFGVRKSPSVMHVKREGMILRPYTSVNEYNFMRGGAFTLGAKGVSVTAFASFKQIDGNILTAIDSSINADESFSSFNESGFHRTQNEINDRNSINLLTTGGNISYAKRAWHVGANAVYSRFFGNYSRTLYPYNQFDLNRNQLVNASIDYHFVVKNFHFFGEEAISDNLGFGLLNGVMMSLDKKVDVSILHRYYSRNYQTIYASAFAEGSRPQNENGLYFGLSVRPISMLRFDAYFDLYMSKWLKYLTEAPSWGSDNFLQATFTPNKKMEMYARYRFELKKKNQTDNDGAFDYLVNERRQSIRFNAKYKISDAVTLANRIEWMNYRMGNSKPENGFVIYQDATFKMLSFPLSFNARLAIFKTSSYNSRIYAYENDVLYSFSIPAYYGNGMRYYLTLRYSATRNIDFWVRFSQTQMFDSKTIGSGQDMINTNHKSEIKLQMRLRF